MHITILCIHCATPIRVPLSAFTLRSDFLLHHDGEPFRCPLCHEEIERSAIVRADPISIRTLFIEMFGPHSFFSSEPQADTARFHAKKSLPDEAVAKRVDAMLAASTDVVTIATVLLLSDVGIDTAAARFKHHGFAVRIERRLFAAPVLYVSREPSVSPAAQLADLVTNDQVGIIWTYSQPFLYEGLDPV